MSCSFALKSTHILQELVGDTEIEPDLDENVNVEVLLQRGSDYVLVLRHWLRNHKAVKAKVLEELRPLLPQSQDERPIAVGGVNTREPRSAQFLGMLSVVCSTSCLLCLLLCRR